MSLEIQAFRRESIEEWLIDWIARELGLPPNEIQTSESLLNYSLSSVTAMMLVGDLEEWLGLTLPPTLVWDYPSIAAIADALTEQVSSKPADVPAGTVYPSGAVSTGDLVNQAGAEAGLLQSLDGLSDQEVDALLSRMISDERLAPSHN